MSSAEREAIMEIICEEHSALRWPCFPPSSVTGMGSYNGCIFLQLTVPKRSFERRIDGIKGSCFSQLDCVAWSRWRGEEPCSSILKGRNAQAQKLAALPLAFTRPVLCGHLEWKSLRRMGFPCLLLSVCRKRLNKQ